MGEVPQSAVERIWHMRQSMPDHGRVFKFKFLKPVSVLFVAFFILVTGSRRSLSL